MIIKYEQYIKESFDIDNIYEYEYLDNLYEQDKEGNHTIYRYMFKDKYNNKYIVNIIIFDYNKYTITVDFQDLETYKKDIKHKISFLNRTYLNLNRFDTNKILMTVFNIIKSFCDENSDIIHEFVFTAEDDKRHNIYKYIINKIFPYWNLYEDIKDTNGVWNLSYKF